MSDISRRKLITTGIVAAAGVAGLGVAAHLADKYGLIPPDQRRNLWHRRNPHLRLTKTSDSPLVGP